MSRSNRSPSAAPRHHCERRPRRSRPSPRRGPRPSWNGRSRATRQPGSTIDVGWSRLPGRPMTGEHRSRLGASIVRLTGPDGTSSTEVVGTETPIGSGHYMAIDRRSRPVASREVDRRDAARRAPRPTAARGRTCIFPLTDDSMVTGLHRGEAAAPSRRRSPSAPRRSRPPVSATPTLRELASLRSWARRRRRRSRPAAWPR